MPNYPKLLYTYEEQRQILDYITNHHAYYSVKGTLLWKEMERLQICKRSWQSMKQRFRNHILPSLKGYKLSQAEMDRFYDGYHNRKKPKAVPNTGGELPTSNLNTITIRDDNSSSSDNVGLKRKRLISEGKRTKMSKIDQNAKVGRWIQPNRATNMDDNETLSHNIDSESIIDILDTTYLKPFGKEEEIEIIKFFEKNLDRLDEKDLDGPYEDINAEFQFRRPVRFLRDRFLNEILPNLVKYNCMSNSAMVAFYDKSDMDIPDQLCEMIDEEYNQKKEKIQLETVPVATSSSESLDATPPFIRSKNEIISSQDAGTSQLEISQTESHLYSQNESQSKVATEQTGKRATTDQALNGTARPPNCRDSLDASIISLNTQLKSPGTSIENIHILPKRDRLKLLRNEVYQNSPGTNHRDRVRLIDKYKSPLHRDQNQNEQQVALTTMDRPEVPNLCKSQQVQTSTIQIDSKSTMTNPLTFKDVLLRQYGTYCESNCAMVSSIAGSIGMYINKVLHFFVPNSTTDCPQIVKLIANEHCISCKQVHVLEDETFAHIRHCKLVKDKYECFLQNVALKATTLEDYLLTSKSKHNSDSLINETISIDSVAIKSQTNILRCSNIENNENTDSSFGNPLTIPTKLTTGTDMEIVATATNENTLNYNKMNDNLVLRNPCLIPIKNMISTKMSNIQTSIDEETINEMSGNLNNNSMVTNDEMCESSPLLSVDGKSEKNLLDLNKTIMTKKSPFKKLSNYFRNKKRDGINKFKCPISNHTKTNNDQNLCSKTGKNDSNSSLSSSTSGNIVQFPNIVDNNVSEIVSNQVNIHQKSSELKEDFFSRSVDDVMNFISNPCQKTITSSQIKNSYCIKNAEQAPGKNVTYSESTHNIINDSIEDVMNFITSPSSNIVTSLQIIPKNCPTAINSKHDRKLVVNMDEMMDFILNSNQNNVELPSNISVNNPVEQSLIRVQNLNIESPKKIVNSLACKVPENIVISQINTEVQQSSIIQQNSNDRFDLLLNNIKVTKYNNHIDFNPGNSFTNPQIQLSHDSILNINNISGEKIKNNQIDLLPKIASNPTESSPVMSVTIHETVTNNTPTKENLSSIKELEDSSELSLIKMQQILEAITIATNKNAQHFCLPEEYFLETPTFSDGTLSDNNYKKADVSIEIQDNSPNKIIEETGISRSSPILKSTNRKLKSHDTEREPRKQNINIDSSINITNPINKENTFESIAKADNAYAFNLSEKVTSRGRRVKNSPKHKRELLKKKVYKQILPVSELAYASIPKEVNLNDNTQNKTELVPITDYDKSSTNSGISITSIETAKLNTTNVTKQSESVPINIGDIKLLKPKQPALVKLSPAIIKKIKYLHNVDIFPVNEQESSSNNTTKINSSLDVINSEINTKFQNLTERLRNSNLNDMPSPVPKMTHTLRNKGLAKPRSKLREDKNTDNSQQSDNECVLIDSVPNAIKNMSSLLTNKANINYSDKSKICSPSGSIWTDTIVSNSEMSSIQDPLAISQDLIIEPLSAEFAPQTNPNNRTPSVSSLNCTDSIALKKPTIKLISPMSFRPRRNVLSKRSQMAVKKLCIDTTHLDVKKIALNIANDFVKFEKDEIDAPVFELLETKLEWNSENGEEQLFGELRNPVE